MRAAPARIMAVIRHEHGLTVKDSWAVYRNARDFMASRGERPSLAALTGKGRYADRVEQVAISIKAPADDWFDYYEGESDIWEITGIYE